MSNAAGSVFDPSATHQTRGSTTRRATWNSGSDGPCYTLDTDNLDVTATGTAGPASIDAIAVLGLDIARMIPSGATSAAIVTGRMRKTIVDSTNGAMTGSSHGIAGMEVLNTKGANSILQAFTHEARIEQECTNTINELAYYKMAMGAQAGTINYLYGFDFPDHTGLGTITARVPVNVRDPKGNCALGGGFTTAVNSIGSATYTLDPSDAGKIQGVLAGTAVTVNCPVSMPAGKTFTFIQTDAASFITPTSSGGSLILNASGHTKSRALYSQIQLVTIATGVYVLSGDTKA